MLFNRISVNWVIPTNKLQNLDSVIPGIVLRKNYERYNNKHNSLSPFLSLSLSRSINVNISISLTRNSSDCNSSSSQTSE